MSEKKQPPPSSLLNSLVEEAEAQRDPEKVREAIRSLLEDEPIDTREELETAIRMYPSLVSSGGFIFDPGSVEVSVERIPKIQHPLEDGEVFDEVVDEVIDDQTAFAIPITEAMGRPTAESTTMLTDLPMQFDGWRPIYVLLFGRLSLDDGCYEDIVSLVADLEAYYWCCDKTDEKAKAAMLTVLFRGLDPSRESLVVQNLGLTMSPAEFRQRYDGLAVAILTRLKTMGKVDPTNYIGYFPPDLLSLHRFNRSDAPIDARMRVLLGWFPHSIRTTFLTILERSYSLRHIQTENNLTTVWLRRFRATVEAGMKHRPSELGHLFTMVSFRGRFDSIYRIACNIFGADEVHKIIQEVVLPKASRALLVAAAANYHCLDGLYLLIRNDPTKLLPASLPASLLDQPGDEIGGNAFVPGDRVFVRRPPV